MARIDFRLSVQEKEQLVREAALEGKSLSELLRARALGGGEDTDRLAAIERRLDRLEEIAGL